MSELRVVSSLALLYAFRMLGLFMVLPVLMLYGGQYQGATATLLGLALGIYGLTQAMFQVPLGLLSDFVGRKPVIIGGLIVFAMGSVLAATAEHVYWLIIGRALQGVGAIASTIMAMVADLTSEQNRTKAMAAIGASIGLSFSLAMILGPAVASAAGLSGVFGLTALLSVIGIAIVIFVIPTPASTDKVKHRDVTAAPALVAKTLRHRELLRLDLGIFCLHAMLMASFVSLPLLIESTLGLEKQVHWKFYLPVLLIAFLVMLPLMLLAEKKRQIKPVMLGAIAGLVLTSIALMSQAEHSLYLIALVFVFFVAFNLLESVLPSLVSKTAPAGTNGTAMGLYSTSQFLGAFCGGVVGGWLLQHYGVSAVFGFSAFLAVLWLLVASAMSPPRHLARLCLAIDKLTGDDKLLNVKGVEEVFWERDAGLLYLKVDKQALDREALRQMTKEELNV